MYACATCGKPLQRVHRTWLQQLRFKAVFQCRQCGSWGYAPRQYRFHFGPHVQCPRCGSTRVNARQTRDRIDPMHRSLLTFVEWILGRGKLYHCYFCRVQFYDRRNLAPDRPPNA